MLIRAPGPDQDEIPEGDEEESTFSGGGRAEYEIR